MGNRIWWWRFPSEENWNSITFYLQKIRLLLKSILLLKVLKGKVLCFVPILKMINLRPLVDHTDSKTKKRHLETKSFSECIYIFPSPHFSKWPLLTLADLAARPLSDFGCIIYHSPIKSPSNKCKQIQTGLLCFQTLWLITWNHDI